MNKQSPEKELIEVKAELEQLKVNYQSLFNHLSDEVHLWKLIRDIDGAIKTWVLSNANPAALKSWGKKKEMVVGKTTDEIFGNGATEQFLPIVEKIISTQQAHKWVEYFEPTNQYLSMCSIPMGDHFLSTGKDVTEEKVRQKTLEESEDFLKQTGEIAKMGGWQFYPQEDKLLITEVTRDIHELPKDHQLQIQEAIDFYDPDDREMVRQHVKKAIEEGKPYTFEARFITSKGNHKWVLSRGIPEMRDGNCVRLSGIFQDITEQKKIARRVNMLTEAIDHALNGFSIVNHKGDFIYVNQAHCSMFGYNNPDELMGTSQENLYSDPSMAQHIVNQLQQKGTYVFSTSAKRKDQSLFDILMHARLDHDEKGDEIYLTSSVDVTDQLRHERELAESKEKFEALFKYSPLAKMLADKQGNYVDVNDEACELLGYSHEELTSFTIRDIIAEKHIEPELRYKEFIKKGDESGQITLARKNGELRIVEYHAKKIGPNRYLSSFIDITEKLKAEADKKRVQQEYKNITDSIPGVVLKYKLNPDGSDTILYISQGAKELFEIEPEDALNDSKVIWDLIDPEDVKQMVPSIQKSAAELSRWEFQYRVYLASGQTKWVHLRGIPEKSEDGSIIWNTVGLDITKRVEAEKELELINDNLQALVEERAQKAITLSKELEKYWLVAEHAKSGVWYYDVRTNGLEWDSIMYDLFGIDKEEFSGAYDAWESSLHPDDLEENVRALKETIATGRDLHIIFRIIHGKTAEIRHIRGRGKAEKDFEGNTYAVFGTNWDVTEEIELVQEREKIIKELEVYKTAANNAEVGVWILNPGNNSSQWDDILLGIYELNGEDFPDSIVPFERYIEIVHPDDRAMVKKELKKTLRTGEPMDFVYKIVSAVSKTQKYIRAKGKVLKDRTGQITFIYGTNWDITKEMTLVKFQEKALRELQEAHAKLVQSEKMASLGILTAGVAHELNNPLNFIVGGYTVIEQELEDNRGKIDLEKLKEYLDWIKTGADRASKIVQSLNQFSRTNKESTELCPLHEIIDDCLLMLHNKYKDRIEISKDYADSETKVIGNNGKLRQVFLNILSNAIDAIPEKGFIAIKTQVDKDRYIVQVSDNGIGIKEANINKVLDPFFTTKMPGEGTGLGLSITNSIIQEHNGDLKITSKEGKGTQISISFLKIKDHGK